MGIVANCKEATTRVMSLMHMVYTLRYVLIYLYTAYTSSLKRVEQSFIRHKRKEN